MNMKKLLFLVSAFALVGIFGQVSAQSATSVIERYNKATGVGAVDVSKSNMMMKMTISNMGMTMPYTIVMANPTHRMRMEMEANGQKILIVVSGEKGWMSMPGMGVQPLPAEQIKQFQGQVDLLSNVKWDEGSYGFELLPQVTENGKKYDVVRAKSKKADVSGKDQTIYFDHATGLAAFIETEAAPGQNARVLFGNYKTAGKLKFPSELKTLMGGREISTITIDALEFDYPVKDEMFAEPK